MKLFFAPWLRAGLLAAAALSLPFAVQAQQSD